MAQILQSKNLATKFRILVEIAANQPTIHQKSIAAKLAVTPQAISEYMMKLEQDGWVVSDGRSKYRVTPEGINWVLQMLRDMITYADYVQQAITNVTVCAAVADDDLIKGQPVGLAMKNGLLIATSDVDIGATGVVVSDAKKGDDVGVSSIEGIVAFEKGQATILTVPDIQGGGSTKVDLKLLKKECAKDQILGAIGIEAMVALHRAGIESQYTCGVSEAAVEAIKTGLSFCIVCSADALPSLLVKLRDENIKYSIIDVSLRSK